jgi:hypothetical protein
MVHRELLRALDFLYDCVLTPVVARNVKDHTERLRRTKAAVQPAPSVCEEVHRCGRSECRESSHVESDLPGARMNDALNECDSQVPNNVRRAFEVPGFTIRRHSSQRAKFPLDPNGSGIVGGAPTATIVESTSRAPVALGEAITLTTTSEARMRLSMLGRLSVLGASKLNVRCSVGKRRTSYSGTAPPEYERAPPSSATAVPDGTLRLET